LQIDWLTVAAQIVNFLVLVWLLKRFLYKPITDAMRRREERIEERLAEAKAARKEAEENARKLEEQKAELDASKDDILDAARGEAEDLRKRLESDIREEMEDRRKTWRAHLEEEREGFLASLRRQAGSRVLEITGDILSDFADTDLNSRVVAGFAERLERLDPGTLDKMREAASDETTVATVVTSASIDSASKGQITRAIRETLSSGIEVHYEEDPEIVLGVRLTIGDFSADWSAARYLRRLETEMGEVIDAGTRRTGREKDAAGHEDGTGDTEDTADRDRASA
jgi:F-type H+-transporting ATPase subunit b